MAHVDTKATAVTLTVTVVMLLLMLRKLPWLNGLIPAPTMTFFQAAGIAPGVLLTAFISILAGMWVGFSYRTWALKKARRTRIS